MEDTPWLVTGSTEYERISQETQNIYRMFTDFLFFCFLTEVLKEFVVNQILNSIGYNCLRDFLKFDLVL